MRQGRLIAAVSLAVIAAIPLALAQSASAAGTGFNLQVSPSPLVATVQPGVKSEVALKVYNNGVEPEALKIATRQFSFDSGSGQVNLSNTTDDQVNPWLRFAAPTFTVQPGQFFTEAIQLNFPKTAGFSYSFALVISPQNEQHITSNGRAINGSLAVFTLLNVNKPGATANLKVVSLTSKKHVYEYLPATFNVRLKNIGNTIIQPYGNIFVGRTANAKTPLATLTLNSNHEYILPGTQRSISASWNEGFATYQASPTPSGNTVQHLAINWSKLSEFRIGRYTAHLVAVYNNGTYDVPIEGTVSFWVVPWKAILLLLGAIVGLWFIARWLGKRRTDKAVKRALSAAEAARKTAEERHE